MRRVLSVWAASASLAGLTSCGAYAIYSAPEANYPVRVGPIQPTAAADAPYRETVAPTRTEHTVLCRDPGQTPPTDLSRRPDRSEVGYGHRWDPFEVGPRTVAATWTRDFGAAPPGWVRIDQLRATHVGSFSLSFDVAKFVGQSSVVLPAESLVDARARAGSSAELAEAAESELP